jgi:hypothetical protein
MQPVPMPQPAQPSVPASGLAQPQPAAPFTMVCPQCHQPVQPEFYYCPNCGKKLNEAPLPTDLGAQIMLYGFSIILPIICYIAVGYWQGIKYARSADPAAQRMGWIAIILIAASTFVTFWLAAIWINQAISQATSSVGNLGGY